MIIKLLIFAAVFLEFANSQNLDLLSLSRLTASPRRGSSGINCEEKDTHFELVTGFVFTAPNEMLDSRPGTLMLTDCIDLCRRNSSCQSANFETGLCVLFGSSADQFPGGMTASQFPVFTLYIQKVCLSGSALPEGTKHSQCHRSWSFEKVSGFSLNKYAKKRGRVASRQNCAMLCLSEKEFVCRSATYNSVTRDCRISDMDRHTVANTGAFVESPDDEYLENNCVEDPVKLCDFQLLPNSIMKTVDSVYQDVPSMEACRKLCLSAPFRCHSFDFGDTGERVCRLSHHTSTTLNKIKEPFLVINDVIGTYELGACYNVTIDCRSSNMIATVRTNKIFSGKIYAKDNPNSCVIDVDDSIEFSIDMKYNDIECNVKKLSKGVYSNEVIIQHHDSIVTSTDLGLSLKCQYDLSNRTVINNFDLAIDGEIEPSLFEEAVVDSPNVMMRITERGGGEIHSAQVGQALELRFEIFDSESPYEIFVRDLVAKDGNDQTEIVLLDSDGCPAEGQIMGPLSKFDVDSKIILANFDAFKFPTSEVVQFRAHVTPCMPKCKPVECSYNNYYGENNGVNTRVSSYGRRRRRRSAAEQNEQDLLVTEKFVVVDKFQAKVKNTTTTTSDSQDFFFDDKREVPLSISPLKIGTNSDDLCFNSMGLLLGCFLFVILQSIILTIWTYFLKSKRKKKKMAMQGGGGVNDECDAARFNRKVFNPYALR